MKTATRTWKCSRCIMQMNYSYALRVHLGRADIIHSQREIKEIFDPEKLTFSINS